MATQATQETTHFPQPDRSPSSAVKPYETVSHWADTGCLRIASIRGRKRFYDRKVTLGRIQRIRQLQNQRHPLRVIARILDEELPYKHPVID